MRNIDEFVSNLYLSDAYIIQNPSLHEEDSPWKVGKIIPFVDTFVGHINKSHINLLDVGGGAGLILKAISSYIEESHGITVDRYALDLSPGMLEIQKERNPNLVRALNEDICKTSLCDKEIDLTLMIDLLEHVPRSIEALKEVKRISNFVIFKVPLDDNLLSRIGNFIGRGKPRQRAIETVGHVNIYSFGMFKRQVEKYTGQVMDFEFANLFDYFRNSEHYKSEIKPVGKLLHFLAACTFRLSPKLCSLIFSDSVVVLTKCY